MHISHSWLIPLLLPFPYYLVEHQILYVYITKFGLLTPFATMHYSGDQSAFRKADFLNVN